MTYELESIEQWIKSEINPVKLLQNPPTETQLKEWLEFVANEKDRVCRCFREMAFNSNAEMESILNYIGAHQIAIMSMSNMLTDFTNKGILLERPEIRAFYTEIATLLENLLIFIEQYIPDYFDQDVPITDRAATLFRSDTKNALAQLQKLNTHPDIERPLLHIALQPLREFAEHHSHKISYRKLTYLKELTRLLAELIDAEGIDINWELNMVLLYLNFNDPKFVLYAMRRLNEKIALDTIPQKLDKLQWYIQNLPRMETMPGFKFIPSLPSIQEQIIKPIQESYQYYLSKTLPNNGTVSEHKKNGNGIKIKTTLSVTELAVFIKLFVKKGLINNSSQIEVIRFMAEHYTTLKADEISEESLRSKFYNTDPSAIDAVKDILISFMNLLNSEDF